MSQSEISPAVVAVVAVTGKSYMFDPEVPKGTTYMVEKTIMRLDGLRRCHFDGCVKYEAMEGPGDKSCHSVLNDHINFIYVVGYLPTMDELSVMPLHPGTRIEIEIPFAEKYPTYDSVPLYEYARPEIRQLLERRMNSSLCIPAVPESESEREDGVENRNDSDECKDVVFESENVDERENRVATIMEGFIPFNAPNGCDILHGVNVDAIMGGFTPFNAPNGPALLELLRGSYRAIIVRLHRGLPPFMEENKIGTQAAFYELTAAIMAEYQTIFPERVQSLGKDSPWHSICIADALVKHAKAKVIVKAKSSGQTANFDGSPETSQTLV